MKRLSLAGSLLLTLAVPFFIIMTAVRILLIPYIYPDFEYRLPGFPADDYGFTQADRLKWSKISFDYLLNDQPLSWLANQKLPDNTPLYIESELSHMLDVKKLIQSMFNVWWILLAVLVLSGVACWRLKQLREYWLALSNGGWFTLALIGTVLIFVFISFDWLFTNFHEILFTQGNWQFRFSDTLIRLFPIRFWQDAFIWMGLVTLVFALLLGIFGRQLARKK